VEDESIIAMMEKQQLEKEGYNVINTSSGEKAIDIINVKQEPVDLILMDINLGHGIDGTEAAKEILKYHEIPVLFLSSHMEKKIVEKTEKISSYGYVVKNSGITVLDASIKMAFKLFNAKQNLQHRMDEINDLYNNAPCGYHSLSHDGTFLSINDTELKWLGYDLDELIGKKKLIDILTPESLKIFTSSFPTFKQNGNMNNLELSLFRKDGSILPVLVTGKATYDQKGNYVNSRSTITDNTERKLIEFALKKSINELEVHRIELALQKEELEAVKESAEVAVEMNSVLTQELKQAEEKIKLLEDGNN
jgi:PAS domain S-box-containing protein